MVRYKNILVIQTAFIGDAILASSLLEKLHAHFPGASLSILVRKGNESIYDAHPFLREVLVWNKQENKNRNLWKTIWRIRTNKYDCVINCHRFASSGLVTALSGARHKAGYKQNPWSFMFDRAVKHTLSEGRHETERYNQLVEDFTDQQVYKPKIYPTLLQQEKVRSLRVEKYVCMAPASVWFTKQLPAEKWIELCNNTPAGTTVYLLGGPGDHDLCEKIERAARKPGIINLAGKLSLLESAELMKHAVNNYVNDSAPLHLCSAVNAPVTAFFCSTVPGFGFGPVSDHSSVSEVPGLPCKPCGVHGYKQCPLGHFKCGHDIHLPIVP